MIDHWSYSKLSCYLRCPAQFYFRYIEQAPEEQVAISLLLGSAIHDAISLFHARRYQGKEIGPDEIVESFQAQLSLAATKSEVPVRFSKKEPDLDATLELGEAMLREYLRDVQPQAIVALEQELSAPLPGTVPLLGYIDRIEGDEELVVIETKTAARAWTQLDADHSDQISCYAHLLREHGYGRVRYRFEILTKAKAPRLQILETARDERDIGRLITKIQHVVKGVQAGAFSENQGVMCPACSHKISCSS